MTDDSAAHWSNYWQGRTGTDEGTALVGVGIENDHEINAFWDEALSPFPKDSRFLDLACGAGSVIRCAHACGFSNLVGADISGGAIETLKREFPEVEGHIVPADHTGLPLESFDIIVSQFGFEYAGAVQTAAEIARLLKPGGKFIAMVHKTGSAIETEVAEKRAEAKAILGSGFIDAARALFAADTEPRDDRVFQTAIDNFRPAQDALMALARAHQGLAAHLYSGTQTMFQKRENYNTDDIMDWLTGMETEVDAFFGRMDSMVKAAQSEDDVGAIGAAFKAHGLENEKPYVFWTGPNADELAWILKAGSPA